MPRSNRYGKSIKTVLSWVLDRDITDQEMSIAIGMPAATYSRRKREDGFPNFEELQLLGTHFDVSARVLQIAFGLREEDELVLLDADEKRLYHEQGGQPRGETPV